MNDTLAPTVKTPDGNFTIVIHKGSVLAAGWTEDVRSLIDLVHPALRPIASDICTAHGSMLRSSDIAPAIEAVTSYYDGDLVAPSRVSVRQQSGEFRMHAWNTLRRVIPGERITYTEYAARAGRPAAVRAAAAACAMNAAALFVPCHRVLQTGGGLGGFRYGLAIKRRLLGRETGEASPAMLF